MIISKKAYGAADASPGGIFELPTTIALVGGGVLVVGIIAFVLASRRTA